MSWGLSIGIDLSAAAGFDEGIDSCRTLAVSAFADEDPLLFAYRCGANGISDQVIVDSTRSSSRKISSVSTDQGA